MTTCGMFDKISQQLKQYELSLEMSADGNDVRVVCGRMGTETGVVRQIDTSWKQDRQMIERVIKAVCGIGVYRKGIVEFAKYGYGDILGREAEFAAERLAELLMEVV